MRAVPIGAGGSSPDVRQGALGGRRARLDVVTSGSGSGRAFPARPRTQGRVDTKDFASYYTHPFGLAAPAFHCNHTLKTRAAERVFGQPRGPLFSMPFVCADERWTDY